MKHANPHVEAWVIGALLDADGPVLRSRTRDLLDASGLVGRDFTVPRMATVFSAIRQLVESDRQVDAGTVWAVCRGLPGFDDTAQAELSTLQASNNLNRAGVLTHAVGLRRLRLVREVSAFLAIQTDAMREPQVDPAQVSAALEAFAGTFAASTQEIETARRDLLEVLEEWDAVTDGQREAYLRTGIEVLDQAMGGFVQNLNVVGGMPSVGKSALIGEVIFACLERGVRVGLVGLEDATKWLTKRHLARRMGIAVADVCAAPLSDAQQEDLAVQANELAGPLDNLYTYRRAGIDAPALVALCKQWVLNHQVRAIFVDHGGEVQHEHAGRDRYDLAVANTYRALRDLAVNQRVPIVVLCHFNREADKNPEGPPFLSSFAESEYIARLARVALGLWQKPGDNRLRVTVLKRTEGERGITVALERDVAAALVHRKGGAIVDLAREREVDRQQARANAKGKPFQQPMSFVP